MRKILLILITFFSSPLLFSQIYLDSSDFEEKKDKAWRGLVLDLGFNFFNGSGLPELKTWGSRNVNAIFYRGMYIGSSQKFSIASGIGLGMENYNFQDESVRIAPMADSFIVSNQTVDVSNEKSKLSVNYIDIPLEFRFETGEKPSKRFRIAVGGKAGFLFDAHTKVVFTPASDGETMKAKVKNTFGLETFRYGLIGRIGYSYLNFYGYYSLSELFRDGRGPNGNSFTIGITLSPSYLFD